MRNVQSARGGRGFDSPPLGAFNDFYDTPLLAAWQFIYEGFIKTEMFMFDIVRQKFPILSR
ncbi:MAG TPA: hypothetical protein PLQ82_00735, partial [Desulfobacteraceae bacterium]|nr:hypothetical protein [Desulfobacteraceae bacterium]